MDKLQEDARESTWEDYIETAGAALAMGAGAVYFLRHGGAQQLNKFGDYLTGLRSSMLADNLDNSVAKFRSDAYKKAMSMPNKIDVTMDIGFQAAFKAHDIRAEGKEFQSELQRIRFDTKLEYGRSMFDQMVSSTENHYLDENSANIIRSMLSEFAYDTEGIGITQTGIRAKLTNALGENVSQETLDEAVKFASAIQQKMKDPALDDMMKNINQEWVIDVGSFTGFDQNGAAIFDPNTIVDQIRSSNGGIAPEDEVKTIAKKASDILEAQRYKQEQRSQGLIKSIIDTALGDEVTVAEAEEAIARGELNKDVFASRAFQRANAKEPVFQNSWDSLMELRDEYKNSATQLEAFNKITIDGLRRDKNGKIYATTGIRSLQESASEMLADTLPGKMLRATETLYNAKHPEFLIFGRGSLDYTLAEHLGNARKAMETSERVIYMFGRFYRENGTSDLEEITSLRDHTIIASDIGTGKDMLENIRKAEYYKQQGKKPWLERIKDSLDVKPTLKPLDEKYGNNFDWLLNRSTADYDLMEYYIDQAIQGKNQDEAKIGIEVINRTHRFLQNVDKHASLQGASSVKNLKAIQRELSAYVGDTSPAIVAMQEAIKILEDPTNEAAIAYASQIGSKDVATNIQNESLAHLITDFKKNALRTTTQKMTHTDVAKLKAGSIHFVSDDFRTNIAQELIRESFMRVRIAAGEDRAANIINNSLGSAFSGKNTEELIRLRSFAAMSMLDARTHRNAYDQQKEEIAFKVIDELRNIGSTKSTANDFITKSLNEFNARNNLPGGLFRHADKLGYDRGGELFEKTNAWSVVHQSYTFSKQFRTAANILRNNNGQIFEAAKEALKPLTQYISGNDAFGALSKSSIVGYRVLNLVDEQLNHEFDALGYHFNLRFGLRAQDKGSGFEIYKNLLLKRVLPAAAIYTYLDFADDTARSLTGMGIGEAGVSGLANANLALRKVTGATGLDYVLKGVTSDSPIAQYYAGFFGDTNPEWHSYEEEKEYYERGYTPIRKSRYWIFGSSNEYRGGKISYFEPNTLRMMRSNYFMESMYEGSMWTKWSHSLLPTPLNPLSPLNYWLDPYYLEELHKEDRPYPITGSTFAENTPWGIFLNPIADTFIKPRRRMHQDRLGSNGVDVKALVAHINNQIQQRASNAENGDIIYLQNGKLRSMLFTAFNAPTPSERVVSSQGDAVTVSTEYGEYGAGISAEEYSQLAESNAAQLRSEEVAGIPAQQDNAITADKLSVSDRLVISSGKGNIAATALVQTMKQTGVFDALRGANIKIRQRGMLRKDQGFFYENKMQYERSSMEDMLSDSETISDLMTAGKGHDYVHEMAVSSRMITGLYGYMFSAALGIGSNNQKQIATSANMESAGRSFWDLSVGGFGGGPFGGEIMEIARRFIPEYHRMQQVNPLMNTMPDWLPERMHFGDPYTNLPKGEARLPGRGYEALNELHPDIFGQYGAFDRFKILADVAPYSPEYKFWKKVAGSTIRDPKLKKEMQEIKDRVAEQTSGHDFYDYKYIGRGMSQQNAVVSEVLNFGKFKIVGSEQVYKLSGVKISGNPDETTQQVLSRYLLPGQEVTLYTDENPSYAYNTDKDHTINAGVMIAGENVAEQMLKAGDAKKRKGDTSAPTYMLNHNVIVNTLNMAQEALGHANIPVLHSRFLKIESPLESYLDDNVYGTSFQNWSDVWGTYIRPSLQIEASSPIGFGVGLLGTIMNNTLQDSAQTGHNLIRRELEDLGWMKGQTSLNKRVWASRGFRLLDRGAFIGGMAADITFMGSSKALSKIQTAQSAGHALGVAYAAAANPNDLAVSTMAWSRLGYLAAEYMLRNEADDAIVRKTLGKSAALGAAIGAVRWAAAKKMLASDETANTYIPEATRKKWDMQDYFDRLTYIKYMGLYEQAADLAKSKEGVDIRRIIAAQENERKELQEEKEKLHQDLRDLDRRHDADAEEAKKLIRKRLNSVSGAKVGIRGGEYTKSAIMYKNAADATMYGLQEDAVMADIVRALPKTERDYFIEFMKEKDQEKREEILKTVSPLLNRALRTIWKMPLPEKISNEEYFEHHTLPAPTWAGWRPDIDLANVEAKVIYNQGMQFSDMGIYASQYRDPAVINAPNIDYNRSQNSTFLTRLKLQMAMTGLGISSEGISVEPSQDSGIQVVANIAQVIPYKVGEEFDKLFSI